MLKCDITRLGMQVSTAPPPVALRDTQLMGPLKAFYCGSAATHKRGEDPLPESGGDLLVTNGRLLSVHVQVKLLGFTGQKHLHEITRVTSYLS